MENQSCGGRVHDIFQIVIPNERISSKMWNYLSKKLLTITNQRQQAV